MKAATRGYAAAPQHQGLQLAFGVTQAFTQEFHPTISKSILCQAQVGQPLADNQSRRQLLAIGFCKVTVFQRQPLQEALRVAQRPAQALGSLTRELVCCEVQAREGLTDPEAGGEIGPSLSGGRTRCQPEILQIAFWVPQDLTQRGKQIVLVISLKGQMC